MCRLNFLCSYFLFSDHALQSEVPSRLFALSNLHGPPSLNRFVRLFQSIYNCSLPEIFGHQGNKPVDFLTRALVNLIALLLGGFIFIPFSTAHSSDVSRSFCNFPVSFLFVIFLYVIQSSAKSTILESMFLQISFTYIRNSNGLKTLPCGTPEVTLTFLDSCPPTLTLCVRPTRNQKVHYCIHYSLSLSQARWIQSMPPPTSTLLKINKTSCY